MKKFLYFLDHIEEYLLMIMMGAMAIVVIIQVIFRVIGSSFHGPKSFPVTWRSGSLLSARHWA